MGARNDMKIAKLERMKFANSADKYPNKRKEKAKHKERQIYKKFIQNYELE